MAVRYAQGVIEIRQWAVEMAVAVLGGNSSPSALIDLADMIYNWAAIAPQESRA